MIDSKGVKFTQALADDAAAIVDACTRCGKCFEACPMPAPAGIGDAVPARVVGGVLDLLAGGPGTAASVRWADVCTRSGYCVSACDYGVNPRLMMTLAKLASKRLRATPSELSGRAKRAFRDMAGTVRVVSRLQLPPAVLRRISPLPVTKRESRDPPDVVFYTGCNVLRTPHIVLLCLSALDAMETHYEVMGGPAYCCGSFNIGAGDSDSTGQKALTSIERLAAPGAAEVLSWCPSCQIQFGDLALPAYERASADKPFELTPFIAYLDRHLDRLRPHFTARVEKRVALHERPGVPGVMDAVKRILAAIPGVELVELDVPRVGTMSVNVSVLPGFKNELRERELAAAAAANVTTLATVFHACHRELAHYDSGQPYEIVNFMELVGESMGVPVSDLQKQFKQMADVDAIIEDCMDRIVENGLDLDDTREVLQAEFSTAP